MRARNIKPGFFSNEDLAEVSPEGRLLFIGLWCIADREGKLEDRPKRIKGEIFRFDDISANKVSELLDRLSSFGLIIRYEVEGGNYIKIPNFLKHQKPHQNEKPSEIPDPIFVTKAPSALCQGSKEEQPREKALGPDSLNDKSLNNKSLKEDFLDTEASASAVGRADPSTSENDPTLLIPEVLSNVPPNTGNGDARGRISSPQKLGELWNEKAPPELSRVHLPFSRSDRQMDKIRTVVKRHPQMEWWEQVIRKLYGLPFVRGINDKGWKLTFDVMVRDAEMILDGKYEGGSSAARPKGWDALKESMRRRGEVE